MPSTYSLRFRFDYQAPGDNLNTWGTRLNTAVFQLVEDALAKRVAFALSGSKTLTTANGAEDEARCAYLDVTSGSGGSITIPSVEKLYVVRNGSSGDVTVTTGGATNATVKAGEIGWVVCDASTVRRVMLTDLGGLRLTGLGAPVNGTDGATKAYVDAQAFNAVELPGQGPGTIDQFIKSDGTSASWASVAVADVAGAAPLNAPNFTGGISVAGLVELADGIDVSGYQAFDVSAIVGTEIDLSTGPGFTKSISANTTFTFAGALPDDGCAFVVKLVITSAAVDTWPSSVDFENGIKPTLGDGTHYLGFITLDGGTQWVMKPIARAVA